MGKATRWLKGLFGMKKDKGQGQRDAPNSGGQKETKWPEKLGHSGRDRDGDALCSNPNTIPPNITPAEAAWLKSFYGGSDSDKEQSKHAIAVAAATAAAADAAVAAAQAAVAVVRLTSQGRGSREKWAATRIQSAFRGFLARKALRALRSLVKVQALVRGYLVRKQAAATFESMQALIRAQVNIRANRIRSLNPLPHRTRQSMERFDDSGNRKLSFSASFDSINDIPKIVEMDTGRLHPKFRSRKASLGPWEESSSSPCSCRNSPAPRQLSGRVSIPESDWGFTADECRFSTTQSTPRLSGATKSVCGESLFPSYMANTQSFNAKLRSLSAPKQRPEPGSRRRLSLHEMMESRSSLSGARMQRSCSQVQDVLSFKNAVVGSLGRSSDFAKDHLYNAQNHSQD